MFLFFVSNLVLFEKITLHNWSLRNGFKIGRNRPALKEDICLVKNGIQPRQSIFHHFKVFSFIAPTDFQDRNTGW